MSIQDNLNQKLQNASKHGDLEAVKSLVAEGADINSSDGWGRTALHAGVCNGFLNIVKYFIDDTGMSLTITDADGWTLLHYAVINGHMDIIVYLIEEKNIDIEKKTSHTVRVSGLGKTPLMYAVNTHKIEILQYLVAKGANIDARSNDNSTVLHYAVAEKNLVAVKYLIEKGADTEAQTIDGKTPLLLAINKGMLPILNYLFFDCNALLPIFFYSTWGERFKEKYGRESYTHNIFEYFLQNKHRYTSVDVQQFKNIFLNLEMDEADTMNLKSIIKFL